MTPSSLIQNYLLLHLHREFPGLDVWRANVVGRKPGVSIVAAGEPGQGDLTGVWGGRCRACDRMHGTYEGCRELVPSGRSIWIEIKAPGDYQSPAQKDFERRVSCRGALYVICRVRKRETVKEIEAWMRIRVDQRSAIPHPAEIAAFFGELRGQL